MKIPLLENFMFDEPSIWVTATTVITLISTLYLASAEVFGSHLQYSKFDSNKKPSAKLSSRTGMLLLYSPAFLAGLFSFFIFPGGGIRFLLLKFAVTLHFFKRDLEVLFVHKYSGTMGLGSIIIISAFYLIAAASMIVVHFVTLRLPEPSVDLKSVGLVIFLVGIYGNFYHHNLLSKLRKNDDKEYKIPQDGLFGLVICPHYLFEILIFVGISFISQTPVAFASAFGDSLYLVARSHATRKWYASKFEDFPQSVKCVIPFIF